MNKNFSKKNNGFTLAEVLITLGIIGVVAALTIPVFIANYKNKVLLNQAKNAYSKLSNALLLAKSQNDYNSYAELFTPNATNDDLIQELSKNIQMTKICKNAQGGCWNWKTKYYKKTYYNGNTIYLDYTRNSSAVLNDGSVILISNFNKNGDCNWVNSYVKRDSKGNPLKDENGNNIIANDKDYRCGQIIIDVNGAKAPNQMGADTFDFDVFPEKLSSQWYSFLYDDKLKYENYQEGEE